MNSTEKESSLLRGLALQQKDAIESIYRSNYPMVEHLITSNNGTSDDAADIFQEAMIVLYHKSRDPEFQLNCQLKTYLYAVSRRLWLKKMQQHQKMKLQMIDSESFVNISEDAEDLEQHQKSFHIMEMAMSKIGEPCKSILEAYYMKNKNMQEIAANFNYTNADNAKTQKYKCMVRLKKLFFNEYNKI